MDPATGRARSRARGRARGQKPPEPARRPGDVPTTTPLAQMSSAAARPVAQPSLPAGAGRAIHRGASSVESRLGEGPLKEAVAGLEQLTVGERSVGRGVMRGRRVAAEELHSRPPTCVDKTGTNGKKIELLANYIRVISKRGLEFIFYQYRVEFSPSVESSKMRRAMLFDHLDKIGRSFVFDGMDDLKTTNRLPQDEMEMYSTRRTDDEAIRITLKLVGELNGKHPEVIRLLNTQQRKNFMHMEYVDLGRYFYDMQAKIPIPQYKIELCPGVITAIRAHENNLLMVVDNIFKVLRLDTVLDRIREIYSRNPQNYKNQVVKELAGSIVMTKYNKKTYSLDDFDFDKKPMDTFERNKRGVTDRISYVDYYKNQYDVVIEDKKQPLIICRPKERDIRGGRKDSIYLVPELCILTGLTEEMKSDFNLMKEVAKTTRPGPLSRVEQIKTFVNRCNSNAKVKEDMDRWGIKYETEPVKIVGRVMDAEMIVQGHHTFLAHNGDFSKDMRSKPMHVPKHLDKFAMISTNRDKGSCQDLYETFRKVCGPMQMNVKPPIMTTLNDDRTTSFLSAIKDVVSQGVNLVIIVVPNNRKDRYDAIKRLCCLDAPVPSQVVVARTLSKKQMLMSVATKIAIQINCKLGGEAWAVKIPLKQMVMIVGFDTYHDSFQKGRSVGAVVASMNNSFTCWESRCAFHTQREELSDHLRTNFSILLKKFYKINNDLPDMILIYRDGVSDGQLEYVKEHEVRQLLGAYDDLASGGKQPRFAFIVVNKRISTRFFTSGRIDNPPPGTVIDTEVTKPERYDFYLISQSVRQGTVSPTQFNVIEDSTGLKPDHIQRLTYKLTHMYANWQGTIRVPAPCQYAHKLAFLVGQSLHKEPADVLQDKLFYL